MDREDELGAGPRLSEEEFTALYRERYEELRLRLEAEPGVRAVIIFLLGAVQSARGAAMVATFAVFTLVISVLACAVPIRRALRVEPTEALRAGS